MNKKRLFGGLVVVLIAMTGCNNRQPIEKYTTIDTYEGQSRKDRDQMETDNIDVISKICSDIYNDAIRTNTLGRVDMIRSIVNRLGENGFTAVDSENQIDMTEPDKLIQFCGKVDAGEEAELTVMVVSYLGGFTKYDFKTESGNVDIVREYYQYFNGCMEHRSTGTYRADIWELTEEGYLFFEGYWFSEEYFILTMNDVPERAALRVEPIDEKCRELNRQYILPIGYERNNMFIVDWSEDDFGELDFYDLFDIFYLPVYHQRVPYVPDENLQVGVVYRIPKEEFETVIFPYFKIDSETLQSKTTYFSEDAAYEYKPRGFYEIEYPEMPYPEVVNYVDNNNGTMTLTVNVVFPDQMISKVYAHEVTIRPLDDGGVQYVSNRMIPSEDNYGQTWNVPRLTEEEWEERYGDLD